MDILPLLSQPEAWVALATLVAMELVLGIDNLIFISIVTNKLPPGRRESARRIGIGLALGLRLALLAAIAWIVRLTEPVVELLGHAFSWKDIVLVAGGFFLVWKATHEIHQRVDPAASGDLAAVDGEADGDGAATGAAAGAATIAMPAAIGQILLLDLVFSLDSIVTAVGMTPHLPIMVVAVVVAVAAMLLAADPLGDFVDANPTVLMLALGFLLMIGMTLIAEGFGMHVPKGYVYTAMAFSAGVEALNILARRRRRLARRRAGR